jgi:dipeptidyl aminopeptidase/acylaminoacyl peptidase
MVIEQSWYTPTYMRSYVLTALLGGALASAQSGASSRKPVTLDDQHKFLDVADPQCSPDGKWIAYQVSTTDTKEDKRDTDLWMVSVDGKENIRLTSSSESESRPKWSPDGKLLAFLSSRPGKAKGNQVWILDRRGGEARQVTDTKHRLSDFVWSPDSKQLLLTMQELDEPAPEDGKPPAKPKPIVLDRYNFKRDITGDLSSKHPARLYLFDIESKKVETLTKEEFEENGAAWSPDGKWIAFVSRREPDADRYNNGDIWIAAATAGSTPRKLTTFNGPDSAPIWSPDSKFIAYIQGSEPKLSAYNQPKLAILPLEGGEAKILTASLDRGVSNHRFTADGSALQFLIVDDQSVYIGRVSAKGGAVEKLTTPGRTFMGLSGSGTCTATLMATSTTSPEVHVLDGSTPRKLTSHNDALLASLDLGATEEVKFKNKDGIEIHGLLTKPPGYKSGVKIPMLLRIHGGPNGQDQHALAFERQIFAANGYLVFSVNYRGSSGRGQEFQKTIYGDWGNKEVVDLLAGVDHVVNTMGLADPERLGVGGWSYGGILTDYLIASAPEKFKAAVSGAGSAFQLAMYGHDQYIYQYDNEIGPPWKAMDQWIKISYPFVHADRIKTPTLFMGGEKDFNVPITGSEQMYQALRSLGIPTQLVVYPGEFHGIQRPSFQRDRLQRNLDWYQKYLQTAGRAPTTNE